MMKNDFIARSGAFFYHRVCPGSVMVEQEEPGLHDLVVKDGASDDDGFTK
jgi:hypothetical protein